jgi:hypothetical protein
MKLCDAGQIKEQDVPLTSIGFTSFFRCLIFDISFFTKADVVTNKDEKSKKNRETDAGQVKEQGLGLKNAFSKKFHNS